jgi:hypothetical protein
MFLIEMSNHMFFTVGTITDYISLILNINKEKLAENSYNKN